MEYQSQTIGKIIPSLLKARLAIPPIPKKATNPFFAKSDDPQKGKYATLSDALDIVTPILSAHDLVLLFRCCSPEDGSLVAVDTMLYHVSGEWLCSHLAMPPVKKDAHTYIGGVTYLKRAGLFALLSLSGEEDDDGNAAQSGMWNLDKHKRKPRKTTKKADGFTFMDIQKQGDGQAFTDFCNAIDDATDAVKMDDLGTEISMSKSRAGVLSEDQVGLLKDRYKEKRNEIAGREI